MRLFALSTVVLAGCVEGGSTLFASAPLAGSPTGMVVDDADNLVVQVSSTPCCELVGLNSSAATPVYTHPVGLGRPMASDGRVYALLEDGIAAFAGGALQWEYRLPDARVVSVPGAVTGAGVVVFVTEQGSEAGVHAVTRLGDRVWDRVIEAPVVAPIRVGPDGTLYVSTGERLLALDGESGGVLWSEPTTARILATFADGVLADLGGTVARLGLDGRITWSSDIAVGEGGATLTDDGHAWVVGPSTVTRVNLETGTLATVHTRTCGPLAMGIDNQAYGLCRDLGTDGYGLTSLGAVALDVGRPLAGRPVGPPILLRGSAFVLFDGQSPRMAGYAGVTLAGDSPWPMADGVGNTSRPE